MVDCSAAVQEPRQKNGEEQGNAGKFGRETLTALTSLIQYSIELTIRHVPQNHRRIPGAAGEYASIGRESQGSYR